MSFLALLKIWKTCKGHLSIEGTMDDFLKKFDLHWIANKFPHKNETILVALSGGKDSMALASVLLQQGYSIAIAHCNYQLRGEASNLDEQLVTDWATKKNVPIHCVRFDTQHKMLELKMSLQETARSLRYEWFQSLCKEHNYFAIATAHHANDNAETLFINLCKGTGIGGLHGIPVRNENIIRPFLYATRQEIDHYVHSTQVPFREDESNASTKYLRNAVRHNIIPALNEIFPNLVDRLYETTQRIKQVELIYNEAIQIEKKKLIEKRGLDEYIPILKLKKQVGFEAICYEIFTGYHFTPSQIPEIIKLMNSESGRFMASPTHKVVKDRNFLIITSISTKETELVLINEEQELIETAEGHFQLKHLGPVDFSNTNPQTAFIDADEISFPLTLRRWKSADYFYPLGMGMKKKKLSRFLIDQKIPLHLKDKIWIVACGQKIVWISGFRLDERFKINSHTKKVLQIIFLPK